MDEHDQLRSAARLQQVRRAFDVLPTERWRIVERPPIGRDGDVVALVIGSAGVFVVHAVDGTGESSLWTRQGRDARRRNRDHVTATRRQVRLAATRLSGATDRIVVVRGVLVVTADVERSRPDPVVEIVSLEALPRLLLTTRDEVLNEQQVERLERVARDRATWQPGAFGWLGNSHTA